MKKAKYVFVFLIFAAVLSVSATSGNAQNSSQSAQENADKIRIVNVTAASPVVDGEQNEFTIEIEYTLESMDEGSVAIGFNVENLGRFRIDDAEESQKRNKYHYAQSQSHSERLEGKRRFFSDGESVAVSGSAR